MACVPLSLVAAIFSMSEPYGPGSEGFWIYWVTALPTTAFVMGFLVLDNRYPARSVLWAQLQRVKLTILA